MLTSRPAPLTASRPLHIKTPGKALHKARGILQENALHGPRTAKAHRVQVQTPSRGGSPRSTKKPPKEAQLSKAVVTSVVRPLGDKTPFTNRQRSGILDPTPGPAKANRSIRNGKLDFLTLGHALLPSSARKTVRGRHSAGSVFETPVTSGNHWEVIEGDVIAPLASEVQGEEAQPEDYDEIEYMPPTAIDPPYAPHFDVPDYKLMGIQLFDMMHSFPKDDATDRFYAAEKENIDDARLLEASGFSASPSQWNFFELAEDDDPSPLSSHRGAEASKLRTKVLPTTQRTGHVAKAVHGASVPRTRAATIPVPHPPKQPAPLKHGQPVRVVPTPTAAPSKRTPQIRPPTRPATATGRTGSTFSVAPASTQRILARPATSAALRPPTTTRTSKLPKKLQKGPMPLAADPETVLKFEGVGVWNDDFMFDV
ncbi:hypothetical protein BJV74DRAFT_845937 [Russula compacta]|nr:hypothetical protein BJV74DRAFT_845937 [Russula compacta]